MSKSKKLENLATVLDQVKSGARSFKKLDKETRLELVTMLHERGLKNGEISGVLGVAVRSVQRYVEELRGRLAIDPTPELVRQIVGVYHQSREQRVRNLSRIAQDPKVPAQVRVEAEFRIFQIDTMHFKTMQSAGYVPMANPSAEIGCGGGASPISVSGIMTELIRVTEISRKRLAPDDPTRMELDEAGKLMPQDFGPAKHDT